MISLEDSEMRTKLIACAAAVLVLAGGTWAYSRSAAKSDCCFPGSPCCFPGSPCCDDDCCFPGSPCCDAAGCCLTEKAAAKGDAGAETKGCATTAAGDCRAR
jgi:hypothetical protein